MPIGVIANALAVALGGVLGALLGDRLSERFKENINMIFGCCAMAMGIKSIVLMENMAAVILAVVLGTVLGLAVHLGKGIDRAGAAMQRLVSRVVKSGGRGLPQEEFDALLLTTLVLFCASGTGIYGSMVAGISGDHSVLFAKSVLDLFTALIFACSLGAVVSLVAVPQFLIFWLIYALGGVILPHTTPTMIADFKACGGFLMLATGFRMIRVRMFPIADMLPSMALVMPISWLWTAVVAPAIAALA